MSSQFLLVFSCKDAYRIIATVTTFLSDQQAFICELAEFGDPKTGRFFLRCLFDFPDQSVDLQSLKQKFAPIAQQFQANWNIIEPSYKPKTLILVSKCGHCLNDLLYRYQVQRLGIEVNAVISNHTELEEMVRGFHLPFHYLPVSPANKLEQEKQIFSLVEKEGIDLIILARYMQILSPFLTEKLPGKIINIHHSFLPSFIGARPYHQAFERGVKIIGATAHYVTQNLDEGPIIEQEVLRVDHVRSPEELSSLGCDIETQVLARAVKYHIQNRVFLNGNKTVIFK